MAVAFRMQPFKFFQAKKQAREKNVKCFFTPDSCHVRCRRATSGLGWHRPSGSSGRCPPWRPRKRRRGRKWLKENLADEKFRSEWRTTTTSKTFVLHLVSPTHIEMHLAVACERTRNKINLRWIFSHSFWQTGSVKAITVSLWLLHRPRNSWRVMLLLTINLFLRINGLSSRA